MGLRILLLMILQIRILVDSCALHANAGEACSMIRNSESTSGKQRALLVAALDNSDSANLVCNISILLVCI